MPNLQNYTNPTEDLECEAFHQWLEAKHIPHHHIANESRSGRYGAIRGAKLKRMGQSAGFPDYLLVIPDWRHGAAGILGDYIQKRRLLFIEMKRKKGGTISLNQRKWLEILNSAGIDSVVCRGADEAIKFVEDKL